MEEYKRFTISLPKELYNEFELFRKTLDISRSDAIRKAMKALMISEENILISSGNVVGCISIIMAHKHFEHKENHQDIKEEDELDDHSHAIDHDHTYHNHDYGSRPIYANIQQADSLLSKDIQHHYADVILSNLHIHLEFEKCMEIIAVSGSYDRIKKLRDDLQRLKSVLSTGFFVVDRED